MHSHDLRSWIPTHAFNEGNPAAERGIRWVLGITTVMMVVEITAGWWFNSMALLADGWHMSSHTLAIGLSALAYAAARRFAHDARFTFGTWKIEVLGGFASAIFLLGIAVFMGIESVMRLMDPQPIRFNEALPVAVLGLVVNVVCAWIIGGAHHGHNRGHDHVHERGHSQGHAHGHDAGERAGAADEHRAQGRGHDHAHEHGRAAGERHAGERARTAHIHTAHEHRAQGRENHGHHDLNLRSAYVHVVADALTSVLAIAALLGGKYAGWTWLDPVMGLVGGTLIAVWAVNLIRDTSRVLLDCEMDRPIVSEIKAAIQKLPASADTRIADLHVWRVGRSRYACILSVVTDDENLTPLHVKKLLAEHEELAHVTAEVNLCPEHTRVNRTGTR